MILLAAAVAAITITVDIREPDPRLRAFEIHQEVDAALVEALIEIENEPSWPWRIAGWACYLACGSVPASTYWRQERSDWEPNGPNASGLQAAIFGGLSMSANVLSEKARKGSHSDAAWASRISALGVCAWNSIWNFNRGQFRE